MSNTIVCCVVKPCCSEARDGLLIFAGSSRFSSCSYRPLPRAKFFSRVADARDFERIQVCSTKNHQQISTQSSNRDSSTRLESVTPQRHQTPTVRTISISPPSRRFNLIRICVLPQEAAKLGSEDRTALICAALPYCDSNIPPSTHHALLPLAHRPPLRPRLQQMPKIPNRRNRTRRLSFLHQKAQFHPTRHTHI